MKSNASHAYAPFPIISDKPSLHTIQFNIVAAYRF